MNKLQPLLLILSLLFTSQQVKADESTIIPKPLKTEIESGYFTLESQLTIHYDTKKIQEVINQFTEFLSTHKIQLKQKKNNKAQLKLVTDKKLSNEAYTLDISPQEIVIKASAEAGFFYALETIKQLINSDSKNLDKAKLELPSLHIEDEPRFSYRGVMLDVSRFFIPKETVLKVMDVMANLKLNTLHLHLVDDNGWRVEIKKYPKLTEVGAWRVDRPEPFPARANPLAHEPTPVGGFYTQEDIKEIVQYAQKRMIEVIPEIEMPAHTISSLAAYPELACPVVDQFIGVIPGIGGPAARIIYCAGNDKVFNFLENVLDEVMELFPSQYIHLGGDEAQKYYWERCPLCQERMKTEGIEEVEELQSYFMNRMSTYVQSKGKQIMGWDELTNSTLPKDAIIFGWQGEGNAALKAAAQGHKFVMTPARKLYFIRYQGPQWFEPFTYFGNNTLKDAYTYEPIKENWKPEYQELLMGVQGSLWTEFCSTPQDVEYLLFPRVVALSELAWSQVENRNWTSFINRLENYFPYLENKGINYAHSIYNLDHRVEVKNNELLVHISSDHPNVEIRYANNHLHPSTNGIKYNKPIPLRESAVLTAQGFIDNKPVGQALHLPINWNKATGKTVLEGPANRQLLTNGLRGSDRHSDFEWVGWYNQDSQFTIDLNKVTPINQVILGTITNFGMGAHKPSSIEIYISNDNKEFKQIGSQQFEEKDVFQKSTHIDNILFDNLREEGRFIQVRFTNPGLCPEFHARAGAPTWVYFDEITIN